ncbi:MAG: thioesterase [Thermoanaerobaculia bacterium]|nr:thioesterase [Thermoanaerobaculia bacterium]
MDDLFDTDASHTREGGSLRQSYRIRSTDVDPAGRATTAALVELLQEAAHADANRLGVGISDLMARGFSWYLKRLHVRLRRTPWIGEAVEVETWPAAVEGLHAIRDYRLFLDGGIDAVEIGMASSAWLLMDVASKKPVRRPHEQLGALRPTTPRRALDVPFDKLPRMPDGDDSSPIVERPFPLRRADLDLNRHVNHGVIVEALLEAVPSDLWCEAELLELEVDFMAEAKPGDSLVTRCRPCRESDPTGPEDTQTRLLHDVICAGDERELVRARSRWVVEAPIRNVVE